MQLLHSIQPQHCSTVTHRLCPLTSLRRDYTRLDAKLHFIDCGERFFTTDQKSIDAAIMPDALHPNAAGYQLLAECLDPLVTKLMQAQPVLEGEQLLSDSDGSTTVM